MARARDRLCPRAPFFLAALAVLLVTIALLLWSESESRGPKLEPIVLCRELDDSLQPQFPAERFPYGTRQICLWFAYDGAQEGEELRIEWLYRQRRVRSETLRFSSPSGFRAYYLIREDGAPLPPGTYAVIFFANGRSRAEREFFVLPRVPRPTHP